MEKEILTKENYASNHYYMSYSRFRRFLHCEASAAAGYHEPPTPSLLIGSYVDAYFSDELEEFKADHPEIFKKDGTLKADFIMCDSLIERINSDETFLHYLSGEKQRIMTGTIDGVPFKIKMDSYIENEAIVDLKVMKDFAKVWSDTFNRYTNFIEAYDYDIEMAIFQEICYQNTGKRLPVYIVAITKETPSDIGIFQLSQTILDRALNLVKEYLPRIKKILNGELAPTRCEKCSYCRSTKKAKVIKIDEEDDFELIGASGDKLREEGYDCSDPKLIKEEKDALEESN